MSQIRRMLQLQDLPNKWYNFSKLRSLFQTRVENWEFNRRLSELFVRNATKKKNGNLQANSNMYTYICTYMCNVSLRLQIYKKWVCRKDTGRTTNTASSYLRRRCFARLSENVYCDSCLNDTKPINHSTLYVSVRRGRSILRPWEEIREHKRGVSDNHNNIMLFCIR